MSAATSSGSRAAARARSRGASIASAASAAAPPASHAANGRTGMEGATAVSSAAGRSASTSTRCPPKRSASSTNASRGALSTITSAGVQSASSCATCTAVFEGYTPTPMAPTCCSARSSTGHRGRFPANTATRSPAPIPWASRAAAAASTARAHASQVSVLAERARPAGYTAHAVACGRTASQCHSHGSSPRGDSGSGAPSTMRVANDAVTRPPPTRASAARPCPWPTPRRSR